MLARRTIKAEREGEKERKSEGGLGERQRVRSKFRQVGLSFNNVILADSFLIWDRL